MRKPIFARIAALFSRPDRSSHQQDASAASLSLSPTQIQDKDDWLFERKRTLAYETVEHGSAAARFKNTLARLDHTARAFAVDDAIRLPDAAPSLTASTFHDGDLFEGEIHPTPVTQEDVIGGEASFLFGELAQESAPERYAA